MIDVTRHVDDPRGPRSIRDRRRIPGHAGLTALVEEIRRLLHADTAALLLVDESGSALLPAAASGLERTARTTLRIPIGQGFAGSVAARRQPRTLTHVGPADVLNPAIRRRGVESLLGVPVILGADLLGVVHVGSLTEREFTAAETQQLQRAADRLAQAVRDELAVEDQTAALVLQRSLLPARLPSVDGLELAARYLPSDGDFGGDWYDVFQLPGDRLGVVMGDVIGHGLTASVVMGRLRSALRAYALDHDDPADVLGRLDRKIHHFEPGVFATVLYGVASPPYASFRFASAGHPPPMLLTPDTPAAVVDLAPDLPLGVEPEWARHAHTVDVPAGAALFLYTDGLVERRPSAAGEPFSIDEGLRTVLAALQLDDAETICTNVLLGVVGEAADDDVALLALRRT